LGFWKIINDYKVVKSNAEFSMNQMLH